ncbi:hypothetical protein [Faecalibacterium hattorii]|jgi:hypothetical protein|uniref:hypothetical protein n=1 Tax=Faecalibacterium hattorii TaxID=2935520 RepID=UPI003AAC2543
MKIIDETGVELTEAPDLSLGRLIDDVEVVHHESIAGVKQVSHFVPIEHLANGSTIVEEVIDVPGMDPQPAWEETVPIQRYIRYTEDELAERRAKEEHEAKMAQIPETLAALKNENEMLKQCLLEMSETVYA